MQPVVATSHATSSLSFLVKVSSFDQILLKGQRMIAFVRRRSHGLVLVDSIDVQALTTAFIFRELDHNIFQAGLNKLGLLLASPFQINLIPKIGKLPIYFKHCAILNNPQTGHRYTVTPRSKIWRNYATHGRFVPRMAQRHRCAISSIWAVFADDNNRTPYPSDT